MDLEYFYFIMLAILLTIDTIIAPLAIGRSNNSDKKFEELKKLIIDSNKNRQSNGRK